MRVAVTGAAGFIGGNMLRGLNALGIDDIVATDDLSDARKFRNLLNARISDYVDHHEFYDRLEAGALGHFDAIIHEGACSDTMEQDGRLMMRLNFDCSRRLLDVSERTGSRLLYASSAAVYGGGSQFAEHPANEAPLNVYGFSKLLFDNIVRQRALKSTQVAGFRYFNVYGPGEAHKGRMASVAFHHFNEFREHGKVRLFGAYDGWSAGEQTRDFIHVDDLVRVKMWFLENPDIGGIFNLGTGRAQPFNDIAGAVVNGIRARDQLEPMPLASLVQAGLLEYIDFPEALKGKYQSFTQADVSRLRAVGYDASFMSVEDGVASYLDRLLGNEV